MSVNRTIDEFIADVKALGGKWIFDGVIKLDDGAGTCPMAALMGVKGLCGYRSAEKMLGLTIVDVHLIADAADGRAENKYSTKVEIDIVRAKLIQALVKD